MSRLFRALTFENVLVTAVAFAVFAGGSAFAASQLGKSSVGSKQLKAKSVTAKKIKKNAVTARKIRKNAVSGAKVKDGSLEVGDLSLATMPYARVVYETRSIASQPVALSTETPTGLGLEYPSYTQEAGRLDTYAGSLDISFAPSCEPPRVVRAILLIDSPTLEIEDTGNVGAAGQLVDLTGSPTATINLAPYNGSVGFPPAAAVNHGFKLALQGGCSSGAGILAGNVRIQVVGTK